MNSIDLLLKRQSNPLLQAPAPKEADIDTILKAGMRVPDHAGLTPWHFTLIKDKGLQRLSEVFVEAVTLDQADDAKLAKAAKMPFRAPLIILVSTKFQPHEKVPEQEQIVAAGCSAHAMQMAAYALGYGAMWRTGELSYHPYVKEKLGVTAGNEIIGFLYIGTIAKPLPTKKSRSYDCHISYL